MNEIMAVLRFMPTTNILSKYWLRMTVWRHWVANRAPAYK